MVESVAARWRACGMMLTMSGPGLAVVGLLIAAGIVGVVVPVLPGAALAWAAIGVWAVAVGSAAAWGGVAGAALLIRRAPPLELPLSGRRPRHPGLPPPADAPRPPL